MKDKEIQLKNEQIIENYQKEEATMVLVFAQWCINKDLDPFELYKKAYPNQLKNETLEYAYEQTVPKEEAEHITDDLLLQVLDLYGNHDLAMVAMEMKNQKQRANDD